MKRTKYRNMHQYFRALENRAENGCLQRFLRWFRDVRCINKCRKILLAELDRDRDESDSLRGLIVVAVNALHHARQSQEVKSALVEQDERQIRDIIAHGGTTADVLKYLDCPTA